VAGRKNRWQLHRQGRERHRTCRRRLLGGLGQWTFTSKHLTEDEARRIANAITRLPEFLMQRQGFYPRGGGDRWKPGRPYHVALEDSYIRAHWDEIDALCKLNSIPFNATGKKIRDGGLWCVYEFTWQLDAIQFWNRFEGRWLHKKRIPLSRTSKGLAADEAAQELAEVRLAKSEGMNQCAITSRITANLGERLAPGIVQG
jgi:hypothetical protein